MSPSRTILINEPTSPASYWFDAYGRMFDAYKNMAAHADELAQINERLARENAEMRSARVTQDNRRKGGDHG